MAEHVGKQLGYYQLLRLLGRGGFASVYQGEHIHLKSLAAIKVLNTHLTEDLQENFLDEARILARLTHPGIVRLLDFGIDEGVPFLVMEYAPYGTLRQLHPRNMKLPLVMVTNYVNQIAEGLQYAHSHKLIHRDLKPDNVLIGQRGNLLLSDFGVALIAQTTASRNAEVNFAGTAAYMAPEQLRGMPQLASDQYALGIMVYEWLCGTRPFHGTVVELYNQHAVIPPPSLRGHVPELPVEAEQVVLRALSKDPHERFPDVRAFAVALERASQKVQGQGGADIYAVRQPASPHRDVVNPVTQPRDNASADPSSSNQPASFTPETPLLPSEPSTFTSSSAPPATPQLPDPVIPHTEPSTSQVFRAISQAPVPPPEQIRPSQVQLPTPPTAQWQGLSASPVEELLTQETVSASTVVQPTSPTLVQEGQPERGIVITKPVRKKRTRRNVVLLCAALFLLAVLVFGYTNLSIFSHAKQRSITASEPGGAVTATGAAKSGTAIGSTPVSNRSSSTNNTGSSVNGRSSSTGELTPTTQVLPTAGSTSVARSVPTSAPTPTPTTAVQSCTTYGWSISSATGSRTGSFTTSANCGTVKATINSGLLSVTNLTIQACTASGCGSAQLAVPGSTVTLLSNVAARTSFYLKTTSVLSLGITISGTLTC
jgi:serine/threonine protein kinase